MKYFAYCRKSSEGEERQALSIPAQIDEIKRVFGDSPDMEITEWFEEKMSAKAPGRPVWALMIKRIEKGEADGIVAWHPDRLARNSVDGGWIIHLLDRRVLKDLKFVSYSYEHSPQGMFMLQIMFGQSKYYVDNLSVNVKRGMRKKIAMGWWANQAPLGYKNDRETSTIVIDPERFPVLRRAWELLLTGAYGVRQIRDRLNDEWGFRTPKHRKIGGGPLALSSLYKIFKSPFYAGVLDWYGEWRPGKHEPMITLEEYYRAQEILGRPGRPKPETHSFAFTGSLIHCACGLSVTAEEKVKPSGRRYVYYRCTRRSRHERCAQPPVRVEVIEDAVNSLLKNIQLPEYIEQLLVRKFEKGGSEIRGEQERQTTAAEQALAQAQKELRLLVDLRVRDMINDAEYVERRRKLQKQEMRLREAVAKRATEPPLWLELGQSVLLFRKYAADWFQAGKSEDKRLVLQTVGSNSILADRKLSIQAKIPFQKVENPDDFPRWCAIVEALRTPNEENEARMIIEAVRCLQERAQARRAGTPVPPLSPELAKRKIARTETTDVTASRGPHPASASHPCGQDRAA
jgi:DNA invertase Pin-like site-specific DNA recombinase